MKPFSVKWALILNSSTAFTHKWKLTNLVLNNGYLFKWGIITWIIYETEVTLPQGPNFNFTYCIHFSYSKKRSIWSKILLCFKLTSILNTNLISHLPDDFRNTGIMPK